MVTSSNFIASEIGASVSRARPAEEHKTSWGRIAASLKCLARRWAALRPREESGRSWSAIVGSSQLDLA